MLGRVARGLHRLWITPRKVDESCRRDERLRALARETRQNITFSGSRAAAPKPRTSTDTATDFLPTALALTSTVR
jgi:hypothetical protein